MEMMVFVEFNSLFDTIRGPSQGPRRPDQGGRFPLAPFWADSFYAQPVPPLQIVCQAHQTPFPRRLRQAAQRNLPEPQHLFDETIPKTGSTVHLRPR
jgi:hypothetical protein